MAMVKVITTILSDDTTNNVPVELAITGHSLGGLIAVINDGKRGLWLACLHCFPHKKAEVELELFLPWAYLNDSVNDRPRDM